MKKYVLVLFLIVIFLFAVLATGRAQADPVREGKWLREIGELNGGIASFTSSGPDCRWLSEHGVYVCPEPYPAEWPTPDEGDHQRALAQMGSDGLLLVPDSTNRRVMAFNPLSGDVVDENFIPSDPDHLDLPLNAILSPGGNTILVSSYNDDVVQEYDFMGNWLGIFAPAGGPDPTILDTPRGMDLQDNGNLLVATSRNPEIDEVVEFDPAGNPLGPFITDGLGGLDSPYDLHRWMNTWLVGGATSDALHQYSPAGAYLGNFALVNNFPQQIQAAANGNVLVANFSGTQEGVLEFDPAGTVVNNFNPLGDGQRGVYELPNGNLLTTSGTGSGSVYELNRTTGSVVDTKLTGGITPRYIEFVQSPFSIVLTKTVGLDPGACAEESEIEVLEGSMVTYCYTVTNTGNMTFTTHDLQDDPLGTILDDFPIDLNPGATVFITQSTTITQTTVNTATWTAYGGGTVAVAIDSATVNVLPVSISLTKTVGLNLDSCATDDSISVPAGSAVTYCYTVQNTGAVTLTTHDLEDDPLGTLLDDFTYDLAPGATLFITQSATITQTTVNTATWTASSGSGMALALDTATVTAVPISITLNKTVGMDPASCAPTSVITVTAGTEVTYCYTVTNTGGITFTSHILEDSELGTILDGFPFVLAPGASTFVTTTVVATTTVTNSALWTATTPAGPSTTATAQATVNVEPVMEDRKLYLPLMLKDN